MGREEVQMLEESEPNSAQKDPPNDLPSDPLNDPDFMRFQT